MGEVRWMWTDAGGPMHRLSAHNPLRWSCGGVDKILKELLAEHTQRPVTLSMSRDRREHEFESPGAAARWICDHLLELRVRFEVRCGTAFGQHVMVVGAPPELGAWDTSRGVVLQTTAEDYPIWTTGELPCAGLLSGLEYKYVICSDSAAPRWEDGPNRFARLVDSLTDLGEAGDLTVVDSTVGLTARPPQVRFQASAPGPATSFPPPHGQAATAGAEAQAQERSAGSEVLSRSQWSFAGLSAPSIAPSTAPPSGPGSFGIACFPQMVWDHRSAPDTARIDERYTLGRTVGDGAVGVVCEARLLQGGERVRAVKKIRKTLIGDIEDFNREIRMMELMDHPNTLRLFEVFEDNRCVYFVTELCEGGDLIGFMLNERSEGCRELEAAHFMRQSAAALQHCHRQGVAHRDVKLENLLLVEGPDVPPERRRVKLCDMGLADRVPPGGFRGKVSVVGSPTTVAPEVLMAGGGGQPYGVACDLWSLGSVLYSLLSCDAPQGPMLGDGWQRELERGLYDMQSRPWPELPRDCHDLVRSLMCLDVAKRLSAEGCLRHRWLSQDGPNASFRPEVPVMSLRTAEEVTRGLGRWFGHCRLGHFRKAALHVLAQQDGASARLREAFRGLDRGKDGELSLRELVDALAKVLPGGEDNPSVREWREGILPLLPADAALGQTEFLAATMDAEALAEEDRCWDVFRIFDRDRDGTISLDDLEKAFPGAQACAKQGFAEAVAAEGGRITFSRFVELMRESVRPPPAPREGGADSGAGGEAPGGA